MNNDRLAFIVSLKRRKKMKNMRVKGLIKGLDKIRERERIIIQIK